MTIRWFGVLIGIWSYSVFGMHSHFHRQAWEYSFRLGQTPSLESIIGKDTRLKIKAGAECKSGLGIDCPVKIIIFDSIGTLGMGSGSVVSDSVVLTAGHVIESAFLYGPSVKTFAIVFVGDRVYFSERFRIPTQYGNALISGSDDIFGPMFEQDVGLIKFPRNTFSKHQILPLKKPTKLSGVGVRGFGEGFTAVQSTCLAPILQGNKIYHECDTTPGMSGAPVLACDNPKDIKTCAQMGIHTNGVATLSICPRHLLCKRNAATQVNDWILATVKKHTADPVVPRIGVRYSAYIGPLIESVRAKESTTEMGRFLSPIEGLSIRRVTCISESERNREILLRLRRFNAKITNEAKPISELFTELEDIELRELEIRARTLSDC